MLELGEIHQNCDVTFTNFLGGSMPIHRNT